MKSLTRADVEAQTSHMSHPPSFTRIIWSIYCGFFEQGVDRRKVGSRADKPGNRIQGGWKARNQNWGEALRSWWRDALEVNWGAIWRQKHQNLAADSTWEQRRDKSGTAGTGSRTRRKAVPWKEVGGPRGGAGSERPAIELLGLETIWEDSVSVLAGHSGSCAFGTGVQVRNPGWKIEFGGCSQRRENGGCVCYLSLHNKLPKT